MTEQSERNWLMGLHLSVFSGFFFPFGAILAPFLVWKLSKSQSENFRNQMKSVVNFELSVWILFMVVALLLWVAYFVLLVTTRPATSELLSPLAYLIALGVILVAMGVILLYSVVLPIIAAFAVSRGEIPKPYPGIKFIR